MTENYSNTSYRALFFDEEWEYDNCIKDLTQQIDRNPITHLFNNRGVAYYELGNLERAKIDLREAIKLDDLNLTPYYNLIDIYNKEQNYKAVEKEFQKLLDSKFDRSEILFNKAILHSLNSEYLKAIKIYDELINQTPNIQYLKNRAELLIKIGENNRAKSDWIKIEKLNRKPNTV